MVKGSTEASTTSFAAQANAAVDQLRSVAKWMITTLGAVGGVLLAGVQLTSLGEASKSRLVVACIALAAALGATIVAILFLTRVLRTVIIDPSEVRSRAADASSSFAKFVDTRRAVLLPGQPTGIDTVPKLVDRVLHDEQNPPRTPDEVEAAKKLRRRLRDLLWLATYFEVDDEFRAARVALATAAVVIAAGAATFAWAANPPTQQSQPSAAVPQRPVEVQVVLTPSGREDFSAALENACVDAASEAPGVRAIATAAAGADTTVVLIPEGACRTPHRLVVSTRQGSVTSVASAAPQGS